MNTSSFGVERGTLIRPPATANLMIDSADRDASRDPSPFDFQISKKNQLINGFFSRAGTTEVVLEWCEGNIWSGNFSAVYDISGASTVLTDQSTQLTIGGFYTVADALEELMININDLSGSTGVSIRLVTNQGIPFLLTSGGKIRFDTVGGDGLPEALGIDPLDEYDSSFQLKCPDLRRYRYLDFTSAQLTAVQDVKDSSTQTLNRDVLCRWYMAEDSPEPEDQYGFPILMGYKPFQRRRLFNPPKQIKWEQSIPVGNLAFTVYGNSGEILKDYDGNNALIPSESNWLMTIQLSEG